jgi:CelD/BcsL family acetyltransferase involved in cellulose biosynthesis
MITYQVARDDGFDFCSAEYADLFERSEATPFQHPVWLHHLYDVLAPRVGADRRVVTIRRPDGTLAGVLPMVLRRRFGIRRLEYADLGVNDYAAAVLDRDVPEALRRDGELGRTVRESLGTFDTLRIQRTTASAEVLASLIGGGRIVPHHYSSHVVPLPGSADAWRKGLRPDFARHLERKYKRLRPKGPLRVRVVTDPAEVDDVMARLREFRAARFTERGGVDLMQRPDYDVFYRRVAAAMTDSHSPGRLAVLEVGEQVAAVAFDLEHRDRELFLLVGYDVQKLRNYSLGLLIVDELVLAAIDRGHRFFDLTVGDEPYKADFGAVPEPLYEVRTTRTALGTIDLIASDVYLWLRRRAKTLRTAWQNRPKSLKGVQIHRSAAR